MSIQQHVTGKVRRAAINATIVGDPDDFTLVAAVADHEIVVLDVVLGASAALAVQFESTLGGDALTGNIAITEDGNLSPGFNPLGHFKTVSGELLNVQTTGAAGDIDGWIVYMEVRVPTSTGA